MGFLQQSIINSSIIWTQRDATSSATILESTEVAFQKIFTSGTGIGQCDKVYYTSGTLSSGQNIQIDLFNLQRSIFGAVQTINFSGGKIKSFYLENGGSGTLYLYNTGNNGFGFNLIGSGLILSPSGNYSFINQTGVPVSTGKRYFGLVNQEPLINLSYELAILGN